MSRNRDEVDELVHDTADEVLEEIEAAEREEVVEPPADEGSEPEAQHVPVGAGVGGGFIIKDGKRVPA